MAKAYEGLAERADLDFAQFRPTGLAADDATLGLSLPRISLDAIAAKAAAAGVRVSRSIRDVLEHDLAR